MKYSLLFLLLITYHVFAVNNYDPTARYKRNRHVYSAVFNNQIYSPVRFFNNRLRYRIDEHIGQVTINIGERTLTVDTAPLIRDAADMWNQQLASIQSPIQLVEIPQNPPAEVDFWITRANDEQENLLVPSPGDSRINFYARTTPVLPDEMRNHYASEHFSNPGIVIANTFYTTEKDFNTFKNMLLAKYSEQKIADIFVYFIIAHEFGHALGLAHPMLEDSNYIETRGVPINTDRGDLLSLAITAQLSLGEDDARVPIMTQNPMYFLYLYDQRKSERISSDDIGPSQLELSAIEMENACGSRSSSKYKSNSVSSDTCKEKPDIFYPVALKLLPIYQIAMF
ncbi:hypothetical protein [Xenorhabdus innexi]|uniref:Peptidase M10 metallopeptidase domain-containing protein n=1 Tax=Xenorhabdus innexi TaxID=290109 RepID=A0A1N6MWH3_9GAMM|nr:hypothetical protein [Xenorhabdus innexi]PHM29475.1 hypothetical protein Xinn_03652 [Xenorhabdus innexi]SIP73079.1 exported hypothetical protein [Xenorhabdus innexi]